MLIGMPSASPMTRMKTDALDRNAGPKGRLLPHRGSLESRIGAIPLGEGLVSVTLSA